MKNIPGSLLAAIFAALSLLHIYWAFGGRFVSLSAVPSLDGKPVFTPTPFATLAVAAALCAALFVILGQLGFLGEAIPKWFFRLATWVISALFLLRAIGEFRLVGFFKQVRDTDFARLDTWIFSPLCLFIAVSAFLLVWKRD
jgi:hypothetical protein